MGVHHGYTFLKSKYNYNKMKRIRNTLHELHHGKGFSWPCTEGDDGRHVSGISLIGKGAIARAAGEKKHKTLGDMI